MKSSSLFPILVAAAGLSACEHAPYGHDTFTKLRVTNVRGELVAEWIARGYITPLERGYGIDAVERRTAPPFATVAHYPDGWRTTAVGPNIHHWRCPKPLWLAEYEGDAPVVIRSETDGKTFR
ncbi:hypothetical protein [Chthoniobacter flavus]|uniref:hypothetical protein n=1 Tax=Chthoniobacter flavus TaxID=191863 RepID=UPI0012F7D576|nr:hypothetical protein [Chthoniobacter flavus]